MARDRRKPNYGLAENIVFYALIAAIAICLPLLIYRSVSNLRERADDTPFSHEELLVPLEERYGRRRSAQNEDFRIRDGSDRRRIGFDGTDQGQGQGTQPLATEDPFLHADRFFDPGRLACKNYGVYDLEADRLLLQSGADERIFPASLTKILTVLVVLEREKDLARRIEVPREAIDISYLSDASSAGFTVGEKPTVTDLLYGAMLPSGAEACIALAIDIAGSEVAFAELMNARAAELTMNNSHFVNSTGLHDPDQYTTVKDLIKLFTVAMQNPAFADIVNSDRYTTGKLADHPDGLTMYSSVFGPIERNGTVPEGVQIFGGKSGYTEEAGICLITMVRKSERNYVICCMNGSGAVIAPATVDTLLIADEFLK